MKTDTENQFTKLFVIRAQQNMNGVHKHRPYTMLYAVCTARRSVFFLRLLKPYRLAIFEWLN